jgi:hypothetical protein
LPGLNLFAGTVDLDTGALHGRLLANVGALLA